MFVTITSLKLRRLRDFFKLSYRGLKITLQARREPGFIKMKNTGFGYWHYTVSAWETEADLKNFARAGAHREAMRASAEISTEIRTYTFESDRLPDWKTGKRLIFEKGKIISFD